MRHMRVVVERYGGVLSFGSSTTTARSPGGVDHDREVFPESRARRRPRTPTGIRISS